MANDSKTKRASVDPKERIATEAEICQAYESLTEDELLRLYNYAEAKCIKLGFSGQQSAERYSKDGLVKEALIRTLSGQKPWKIVSVQFMAHMIQAVRNIAGHAREHLKSQNAEIEVQMKVVQPRDGVDPLNDTLDLSLDPEQAVLEKEKSKLAEVIFGKLAEAVKDDPNAREVLSGWRANMSGVEIRQALDLTQNDYETLQRKLVRLLEKLSMKEVELEST